MEFYEEAVLTYISAAPGRFVKPQYELRYKDGVGGSCPDFVVIDYMKQTVYVVEVTASADVSGVLTRVRERHTRWYIPLKKEMSQWREEFADWNYRVTLFVRDAKKIELKEMNDVFAISIDSIIFPWAWDWKGQLVLNPLECCNIKNFE
jgi:hypothetical protein